MFDWPQVLGFSGPLTRRRSRLCERIYFSALRADLESTPGTLPSRHQAPDVPAGNTQRMPK